MVGFINMQFFALILLIKSTNSNETNMEGFIIGGDYVTISSFPHSAYLSVNCEEYWICGSSVLNQRILLTAAHCVHGCPSTYEINVYAGHQDLNQAKVIRSVNKFVFHGGYEETTITNDIALVHLKTSLPLGSHIKRIMLARNFPRVKMAHVAGWGVINDKTEQLSIKLKSVPQVLKSPGYCNKILSMRPGMMCAESYKKDHRPSQGDFGSALVANTNHQIGLVSFRRNKHRDLIVYSNVTYFYNWIQRAAKTLYCARGK